MSKKVRRQTKVITGWTAQERAKGHNRILRSLRVGSFGRLGVQHFFHKHSAFDPDFLIHDLEIIPAFYGFYGFAACVGLVYVSKLMRGWKEKKFLMRDENYWEK